MDNRSSFGLPNSAPGSGYGGVIPALTELPVNRMHASFTVSGAGTINSLPPLPRGTMIALAFAGAVPTFIHSSRLLCPGNQNYVGVVSDLVTARSRGDGVWQLYVQSPGLASATAAAITALATRPPYLGQVATRSFVPRLFSAINKQMMSRSRHRAADSISSLRIAIPNWMVDFTVSNGEAGVGATASVTASIEYPVGTFTQVKFSGSATGSIPNGQTLLSDVVNAVIPENAFFFVRFYYTNTAGIPYQDQTGDDANGEALTYGVSGVTDQTMSGTVVQTTANFHASPCAIVAITQKPAIMIVGASNVYGSGDTHDDTSGDSGSIARSIGPSLAYINSSVRGDLANYYVNNGNTQRTALKAYCTHVIFGLGRNDLAILSRTAVQVLADLQTLWALFSDKLIYQITLEPTSASTDAWATTVNQTTDASNAQRILLNASIRAAPAPLVNYIEIADLYETARDSGIWKATGGAWTPEGVHGNVIAQNFVRNSRTVDPAVITQSPFALSGIAQALLDLKAPLLTPTITGPARITGSLGLALGANLAPDAPLTINSNTAATVAPIAGTGVHTAGADGVTNAHVFDAFGNNNTLYFRQANGTLASKTASSTVSSIASWNFQGWDTTGYFNGAQLRVFPSETWSATAHGAEVRVSTTPNTTATVTEGVRFQNSGGLSVGATAISNDPGVGNIYASNAIQVGSFTVGTLPSGVTGRAVWCSNCRVFNGAGTQEGAGSGTGGWVTYNGSAWKIAGTNVTAVA